MAKLNTVKLNTVKLNAAKPNTIDIVGKENGANDQDYQRVDCSTCYWSWTIMLGNCQCPSGCKHKPRWS